MQKILVPTDFSDCASQAARVAVNLAKKINGWIYFLHISPEPSVKSAVHSGAELEVHHAEVSSAKASLDELVRMGEEKGVTCFPVLVFDNGSEKIENYVKPYSIDLIIMGSHGRTGIRKMIMGSNSLRVVKHAPVPVLVIKQVNEPLHIKTLLFASAFQGDVSPYFTRVAGLANSLKASLHLVYLARVTNPTPEREARKIMEQLASGYTGLKVALDYAVTNDPEWAIQNLADKIQADVISIPPIEKDGVFISHSIAESLVNKENRPILVLNTSP